MYSLYTPGDPYTLKYIYVLETSESHCRAGKDSSTLATIFYSLVKSETGC
jgi:hypothetical protein